LGKRILGHVLADLSAVDILNFIRERAAAMRPLATSTVATCFLFMTVIT